MKKNMYSKRQERGQRSNSARNARYAFLSARGRGNEDTSSNSFRELAYKSKQRTKRHPPTASGRISPASSTSSKGKRKKKQRWYAVVRGHVPGVYSHWDEAWAQTNGYTDGRPYKMNTRQEAVEEFMRWYAGARVHPVSSTMASRGESIGPFADAFIGNVQAEQIREAAFKRRASGWRRTAEVIGGPRLGTGTSTVHKARSVESPRKADTPSRRSA